MSIPSPCYLLAQTETVSSQAISLHWTITRFPISRLVNKGPVGVPIRYLVFKLMKKWSKRHYSLSDFQAHEQRTRRGPLFNTYPNSCQFPIEKRRLHSLPIRFS